MKMKSKPMSVTYNCQKFKPESECFEVVAVSMDHDLCYSGGKLVDIG